MSLITESVSSVVPTSRLRIELVGGMSVQNATVICMLACNVNSTIAVITISVGKLNLNVYPTRKAPISVSIFSLARDAEDENSRIEDSKSKLEDLFK